MIKFSLRKYHLLNALDRAFSVVDKRCPSLPLQSNVWLAAADDSLEIIGSRLDIFSSSVVTAVNVESPGAFFLPQKAYTIVKSIKDDIVDIEVQNGVMSLTCDTYTSDIRLVEDIFVAPEYSTTDYLSIPLESLESALQRCKAVLTDTVRANYSYVFVDAFDGLTKMFATDSSRVHLVEFPYEIKLALHLTVVNELLRWCKVLACASVRISSDEHCSVFQFDADTLITVNHYNAVLPSLQERILKPTAAYTKDLALDKQDLLSLVRRVAITADEVANYLLVQVSAQQLSISATDARGNTSHETLPVRWNYPPLEFGVNCTHLLDLLTATGGSTAHLLFGNERPPMKSYVVGKDSVYTGIIPMLDTQLMGVI